MKPSILVLDDEKSHRLMLEAVLSAQGFSISQANSGENAIDQVKHEFFDLILMDVRMGRIGGIEALKNIKQISPDIPIIIMTAHASINTAVDALKAGAYDYLTKPLDIEELKILVQKALRYYRLEKENAYLKKRLDERFDFSNIIGQSPKMQELFEVISLVAPTDATVLVTGESGTGKELIANAIHQNSNRNEKPFIKVNCAALPETILESELFGHEKGAFTGAISKKPGKFRLADQGSIFLDEVSEMPLYIQPKLLRVLQEGEIDALGSTQTDFVNTRVIAATNRDPAEEIEKGNFREDLYYRLNVVTIDVPPLRQRRNDIKLLAQHFLKKFADKNNKMVKGFVPRVMDIFMRHDWPGNVRELENTVERALIMSRSEMITPLDLPGYFHPERNDDMIDDIRLFAGKPLKAIEKEMIIHTLEQTGGNRTLTAKQLGISRRTLQFKLKEYGVNR